MKNKMKGLALLAALACSVPVLRADDANTTDKDNNAVTHPVNAYRNHEVNEDAQESRENTQKAKEAKVTYKQAKKDYEKSLKDFGASSEVTIKAKKRMNEAYEDMNKYNKKAMKADQELKEDRQKQAQ
jgi:hypothetical protein